MMLSMKMRVIPRHCDSQWCCVCLNFCRNICFNSEFDNSICSIVVLSLLWTKGTQMDVRGMLARHEEIRHRKRWAEKSNPSLWVSHRNNNKCRHPSHARAPRRNPSPLLGPVMSAFAHVPTDQHPIWSDLSVFRVSCSYVFITCLAQTPALPEIFLLPIQNVCRNIITICTPTQNTRIQHMFYNFCCVTSTVT